jgi:hypothetical protein
MGLKNPIIENENYKVPKLPHRVFSEVELCPYRNAQFCTDQP